MSYQVALMSVSALIAIDILLHHPSRTLGIPSLLIFMGVGLVLGNGEFNFFYDDLGVTSLVGGIALNIIVFVGGLQRYLALMVVLTLLTGVFLLLGLSLSLLMGLLLIRHFAPRLPSALLATVLGIALVTSLDLDRDGVQVLGSVPA